MEFYGYTRCSTCRKALAWLRERGLEPRQHDITVTPPSAERISGVLAASGGKRTGLLNISGMSYRALGADAVKAMTDDQLIAALLADGRLLRRPFLVLDDGRVLTGFRPDQWQAALEGVQPADS
ncbi:Spx/MgsR family RNA polymerase-binding regulatory protein [Synechococcus sp. RSCCF101]|uniref:arsenate reductase family protein n=1 Tax=Synechococcus sp. RSCCF101 TaxID=2511069 RepID=UPI001246D974|nr:Spx/MgsR family RNA polymerase-binding regulatory protein [Synechococcus sp. RSCCF101]QEY31383.1 Spx/MgsR family RNA polymerase-binding regulatory protein [Synechococcus sp. RSCCF101]